MDEHSGCKVMPGGRGQGDGKAWGGGRVKGKLGEGGRVKGRSGEG